MSVDDILGIISPLLLVLNIVLSVKTGRDTAKLYHDIKLVKKTIGKGLPGIAYLPVLFMLLLIICINICYLLLSKTITLMILGILAITRLVENPYTGFILSVILITVLFIYYNRRYRGINKPSTKYARLMLEPYDKTKGVIEKYKPW